MYIQVSHTNRQSIKITIGMVVNCKVGMWSEVFFFILIAFLYIDFFAFVMQYFTNVDKKEVLLATKVLLTPNTPLKSLPMGRKCSTQSHNLINLVVL